jgi:two-component system sensor histidine kinase KdpD
VLVGFDHRLHSRQVIRDAWRLAHGLHADLIAVNIQTQGYLAFIRDMTLFLKFGSKAKQHRAAAQQRVDEHALLAEDLGAEVIRISSPNIAHALVEVARQHHITQIVLGQPTRQRWEELLRGSTVNRLLRLSSDIDIHLVPVRRDERNV